MTVLAPLVPAECHLTHVALSDHHSAIDLATAILNLINALWTAHARLRPPRS